MEKLAAMFILNIRWLCDKADYEKELDKQFFADPDNELLLALKMFGNRIHDKYDELWERLAAVSDAKLLGEELMKTLAAYYQKHKNDYYILEGFSRKLYEADGDFDEYIENYEELYAPWHTFRWLEDYEYDADIEREHIKETRELYERRFAPYLTAKGENE